MRTLQRLNREFIRETNFKDWNNIQIIILTQLNLQICLILTEICTIIVYSISYNLVL